MSPIAASPLGDRSLSALLQTHSASPAAETASDAEPAPADAAAAGPSRSATLRANLVAQGLDDAAINTILEHKWAGSTATGHDSAWGQWQRHCDERLDDTRRDNPSASDVINFLQRVRDGEFSDKTVDTFSAEWVRKVRSTVSITVSMWQNRGMRIGEHPLVSAYIEALQKDDFLNRSRRKYKYDDTWDVQLVFDYVSATVRSAAFQALRAAPTSIAYISKLRECVIPLGRILLCSRSSDLTCVFRGDSTNVQCVRFNNDDAGALESVDIRFYCPKQRNTMPVSAKGYTDWISIGVVDDASVCFATLLREYYTVTAPLPQSDDRLFLTEMANKAHAGCHWGLSSQRLANIMKDVMTAAGIPPDFLPHCARHAGIAHQRREGMSDDDVMHRANMSARTYVVHYRRKIRAVRSLGSGG